MESPIRRMSSDDGVRGLGRNELGGIMNTYEGGFQQGTPIIQQFQPINQHNPHHQTQIHQPSPLQFQPISQQHTPLHQTQIHQPSPQHFQPINQAYTYHPQAQIPQPLPISMVIRIVGSYSNKLTYLKVVSYIKASI